MVQQSIPMADGVRLSATLYMPDNAKAGRKIPALLEYLPYRKDDATAARDYPIHNWFAAHGYVSVRVDIRGFGTSEGGPTEREYSEQEQLDGEQVIAWLAASTVVERQGGNVGISRDFNSIQMAMRHPPALKAILAVDATEQLFHDDVHYIDGMMHFDEFELNMDLAPSMTGAPTIPSTKSPRSALRIRALVADVFQASTRRPVLAALRCARSAKSKFPVS